MKRMGFFHGLWFGLRECDEHEWLVCADCPWRSVWREESPRVCPECGGEIQVLLPRREFLALTFQDLRMAFFPYRAYDWTDDGFGPTQWWWRDRLLFTRKDAA